MTTTDVEKKEYNLIALHDTEKEEFKFRRLSRYLMKIEKSENQVYCFYYQDSNGEIWYEEKDVKEVSLIYTSDIARYQIIETTSKDVTSIFGYNISKEYNIQKKIEYKLYIPEGTIVPQMEIDMQ